jgi:hypothetical protein
MRQMFPKDPAVVQLSELNKDAAAHRDPDLYLLPEPPAAMKRKDCTMDAWDAYNMRKQAHEEAVQQVKAGPEYVAQKGRHDGYVAAQRAVATTFFRKLPTKKGWTFDGSVTTDGVSVSLQYSKQVLVLQGKKTKQKPEGPAPTEDYDRKPDTKHEGLAVLGVGRPRTEQPGDRDLPGGRQRQDLEAHPGGLLRPVRHQEAQQAAGLAERGSGAVLGGAGRGRGGVEHVQVCRPAGLPAHLQHLLGRGAPCSAEARGTTCNGISASGRSWTRSGPPSRSTSRRPTRA